MAHSNPDEKSASESPRSAVPSALQESERGWEEYVYVYVRERERKREGGSEGER